VLACWTSWDFLSYEKEKLLCSLPENQKKHKTTCLFRFFENETIEKIGQNLKYDLKYYSNYNITVKGKLFDTMIAHYLINPDMRHNMDTTETYLKYSPQPIEALIGKKGRIKNQCAM
jgi:DNA polymerase-1